MKHGNTLGNQPAERYKLVDKKTGKPLKSGENNSWRVKIWIWQAKKIY
ncbi:hypothetical protein BSPWISOXPB_4156 [uncultured Gammaproteobacteria bacterium]|nr:hypothetical protein BSPWISOXPB_4156 [uncultured Gammaproteobacteria bacterium]